MNKIKKTSCISVVLLYMLIFLFPDIMPNGNKLTQVMTGAFGYNPNDCNNHLHHKTLWRLREGEGGRLGRGYK